VEVVEAAEAVVLRGMEPLGVELELQAEVPIRYPIMQK
jgi:hypothetical protein